jgi:HK97 family phage portal protein
MIREAFEKILGAFRPARVDPVKVQAASLADDFRNGEPMPYGYMLGSTYGSGEEAMKVSALSACVRLIAGNVAKLPFHVFRLIGEDRKRDRKHPIDMLLNQRPNSWQTAHEFRRMLTAHVALYGNGYAIKSTTGARTEELFPQHPTKVKVIKDDPFLPPIYEIQIRPGVMRRYPMSEILHLRDLSLDGIVGLSRIEQARQGMLLTSAAETFATAQFMNNAEPGVALLTEKNLTPDQQKRLITSWKEAHQGPHNASQPTILEGGMKIDRSTATNRDSQFLELRSFQVEDIARMYGVPPHMIGLTEKQTSWGTGIEQMAIGFLEFNLLDWLVMWETAVKRDLFDSEIDTNAFAEHLVDALLRADLKTRTDSYAIAIQTGLLSRNEARKKENLPPYDGGEEFLYPSNMSVNGEPIEASKPAVQPAARFPSDDPKRAWMARVRAARRAIASREAV